MSDQQMPFCKSEFLQDVTIELGRRFAPARHPWGSFQAEVELCEHEGEELERLTVWARTYYGTSAGLALWEDNTVWVSVTSWSAANTLEYRLSFYPGGQEFTPERIAEAFRDTVSVSTRLCYSESPLPTLRRIWNYAGEVETEGALTRLERA